MKIKDMFYKDITRDIKGVIKIGQEDDENVYQELEEYVVTQELSKHFDDFFKAYKKSILGYTDKMGVWISGFFGSGKSHFLKILSYLLENREVEGKKAITYFNDKIQDPMVLADMKLAGETPTDVILFNIDSKSDSDSKANKDAIVKVFMRVFNDMQGFCGSIPWVADLERQMTLDGTYDDFKAAFKEISGRKWVDAREDIYYEEDAIIEALAKSTKMSKEAARNWYNKAEENYTLSVDKFAKRVREYIESKGNNHHVVFLVDEMGQYIGDDSDLMLNLQTVVEDLGTECGGKAWVIVTSQQDIDSMINMKGTRRNDFSKIQGRFDTRLSLSSANVDEVIKKRILLKNDVAKDTLKLLYENKSSVIRNLITFSANTPEKKTYTDAQDFIEVYPFIPYQFKLMQEVLTSVRIHGSSGKHLSEGERSMLSAFQESCIKFTNEDVGILIPFYAFYDTIEAFLDSGIRTVIYHAQENKKLEPFDVELLKLLFMIRYVEEIPANIENLTTLMVNHIDDDKLEIKKEVENSLKRLIRETLVQKTGDEYIFLTHQEQDINREIKNMNVEMSETIRKISEIIFEDIFPEKKYKYSQRYNFSFNQNVDDRLYRGSPTDDIGIKIITPYYETQSELTEQELKLMSERENNLIIKLPQDTAFLEEIEEVLRTEAFLRKTGGSMSTPEIEDIKNRKIRETTTRLNRTKELIKEALKSAEIYANSQKLDIREKNPIDRINEGLKILIEDIYHKLHYIDKFVDSPKDIENILTHNIVQVSLEEENDNKLALNEVANHIERNTLRNIPVTMRSILNHFSKAPYGWNELDIEGLVAKLFKEQEIKLQLNSKYLSIEDKNLINYLTKRDYAERLLIEKRIKVPPFQITNAKNLCQQLFHITALPNDEDGIMREFNKLIETEIYKIEQILEEYDIAPYPGKEILEKGLALFKKISSIDDAKEFFDTLYQDKDALLEYADYSPEVKNFFNKDGKQKEIFNDALAKIKIYEKNKDYLTNPIIAKYIQDIKSIVNMKEPYNDIPRLPDLINKFNIEFAKLLEEESKPIKTSIEESRNKVIEELALCDFGDKYTAKFKNSFDDLLNTLEHSNNLAEIYGLTQLSETLKIRCLDTIQKELESRKTEPTHSGPLHDGEGGTPYKVRKTVNVSLASILPRSRTIESRRDIDNLLAEIKEKLESKLDEETIIKLV
ncbi:BREX system P-loop protein BrxC [Tepidanaerobacter sp. EBM-49]|uniref:BREX system P-loop protein BrxC n=1 Tax=Tepidanaerobacter sp. EBM-49 TaxID=1918504 RepID=UPI000A9C5EE2|nr:BREX system P-loop protein BrxC [Tepidanaerobacter sp. EBM-49]